MHCPPCNAHCSIGFLPASWEVGYNHFSGRLGLKMPETAAILQAYWPEWQARQDPWVIPVYLLFTHHLAASQLLLCIVARRDASGETGSAVCQA
jgi:hypothetical protein